MANLKIIWTTGSPFSPGCIDKIAYETSPSGWNVYRNGSWHSQSCSTGRGYRLATAEEIAEHWKVLHPKWTPEPGDKVIVTQDIGTWCNKRGTIVNADGSEYWIVKRDDDGRTCNFMKQNQMILAPYEETAKSVETPKSTSPESRHGFTIGDIVIPNCDNFKGRQCIVRAFGSSSVGVHCPLGASLGGHTLDGHCPDNTGRWYHPSSLELVSKVEPETISKPSTPSTPSIPIPKEGYITVRLFTEEEFKAEDRWDTFGSKGYPKGWNMDGEMNKYLNTYLQIREVDFRPDKSFTYSGWNFRNADYEVIHEGVETKPEPKSGMITVRFFTEIEFKAKDKWHTPANCPKGWVQAMNKYLGETVEIRKDNIKHDGELSYHGWTFLVDDYEVLTLGYESKSSPKVETKVETKVEPKKPEMKPQRFKVGDRVTYKSYLQCGGKYYYDGEDQKGFVGEINSYDYYVEEKGCYKIYVRTSTGGTYMMLESEFCEYDGSTPVKAKESKQPEKKFAVGDKITYKLHSELDGGYRFGGGDQGKKEGTVLAYLEFQPDYNCYKIKVTTLHGTDYSMLECEFYEYDTLYPGAIFLGTVGLQIHQTVPKSKDDLSQYNQSPVLIHKKPTKRLVVVDAY